MLLAAVTLLATACTKESNPATRERSEILMDTVVRIEANGCDENALAAAFDEIRRVERLMSRFDPDSELSRLNRTAGTPVKVSEATWEVLETADRIHEASGGSFDPTVGAAVNLWESGKARPSRDELRAAKKVTGWDKVELLPGRKARIEPGMSLDLDGIAKGYAADLAAETLKKRGCIRALVNAGGDIRLYAEQGSKPWRLAIEGGNVKIVLKHGGVATSALGKRYLYAGGEKYPHIIDPATLEPINHSATSATAAANTAAEADAWATAAAVMGERALEAADREGVGLALFTENGRWHFNRAWNERLHSGPLFPPGKP